MSAAVQDIHHRNRQRRCPDSSEIPVQRDMKAFGRSSCNGHRYTENRVDSQFFLVFRSVGISHKPVYFSLLQRIFKQNRLADYIDDIACGGAYSKSMIPCITVPQFHRFEFTGGCP